MNLGLKGAFGKDSEATDGGDHLYSLHARTGKKELHESKDTSLPEQPMVTTN